MFFSARLLFEQLCADATKPGSAHDFGHNIIPGMITDHKVFAFPFQDENRKSDAYWRDVGTLDAYYEANMDLISVDPLLNMYDKHWPIRTRPTSNRHRSSCLPKKAHTHVVGKRWTA